MASPQTIARTEDRTAPRAAGAAPRPRSRRPTHPSRAERRAAGKSARKRVPLDAHADLVVDGRADPLALLGSQDGSRVTELVPIRYGRMVATPFSFYRGAALVMAADLARTPSSGLHVQLCGDAHLSNFGVFSTPERHLVFDVNDFDETHPGPFEWDVKRLAASMAVAGRENGHSAKKRRAVALATVAAYREAMTRFARQGNLAVWYAHLDMDEVMRQIGHRLDHKQKKRTRAMLDKARGRDSVQALRKLTTTVDGRTRLLSQPPLLVPIEELWGAEQVDRRLEILRTALTSYRRTLEPHRRHLLDGFRLVQGGRKVVGVGSVGTRAWILLFDGVDGADPLFLQAKEAQRSVLDGFLKPSALKNQGQRVVAGQRWMQASSDIFLGWTRSIGPDGVESDYYLRQLRDGKGSVVVEDMSPSDLIAYGRMCSAVLARAHARSGDRVAIAAYLGSKPRFDEAIADFSEAYADVNESDQQALAVAVAEGRVTAEVGV
jgi:uncharacterized protein (DUF2252 family)